MLITGTTRSIRTDHWQFFVEGSRRAANWDTGDISKRLASARVAPTPDGFVVATARFWGDTRIEVEVYDEEPLLERAGWDDILRCHLDVPDGKVSIFAPEMTGVPEGTMEISMKPGRYDAAVLIGGLDSVTDDVGGIGDDHYRIALWPHTRDLEVKAGLGPAEAYDPPPPKSSPA